MKSDSLTPVLRSVSRMVGQVPSRTRCSAAMTPAVSHPADPPPTITSRFTIVRPVKKEKPLHYSGFSRRATTSGGKLQCCLAPEVVAGSDHVPRTGLRHEHGLVL